MTERAPDKVLYTATATSTGGRGGHSATDDGLVDVEMAPPKEMGGPGGKTNPEQLFATGFAACFNGALGLVAKKQGVDASKAQVTAEVGIGPEGDSFGLAVQIKAAIPDVDHDTAQQLVDAAHQVCPYSKATRGNIPVTVTAV